MSKPIKPLSQEEKEEFENWCPTPEQVEIYYQKTGMPTTVVNIKTDGYDVKICRTPNNEIPDYPAAGFAGNPFFLKDVNDDAERAKVIEQYRKYFEKRIKNDKNFKEGIESLRGKRLACFCSPKPCHGDVIVEYLEGEYNG